MFVIKSFQKVQIYIRMIKETFLKDESSQIKSIILIAVTIKSYKPNILGQNLYNPAKFTA